MALLVTTVQSDRELEQILELQKQNLLGSLKPDEIQSQGFVTMHHTLEVLQQMHELAPSIIIKHHNKVVAYALVMLSECRGLFPPLEPMFKLFEELSWKNNALTSLQFYIMGQICIDKKFRGRGLFDALYKKHKEIYHHQFDCIVTEISTRNKRSIRAHERVGFSTIHTHRDELDEWAVVLWDWEEAMGNR